jgi:hypothetical protein
VVVYLDAATTVGDTGLLQVEAVHAGPPSESEQQRIAHQFLATCYQVNVASLFPDTFSSGLVAKLNPLAAEHIG